MTPTPYHLGPSVLSIAETQQAQCDWFDENVYVVDDVLFGPTTVYSNESMVEKVGQRLDQLNDLMCLTDPVSKEACENGSLCDLSNAQLAAYERYLAGPATNHDDTDPMGDYMGKNL